MVGSWEWGEGARASWSWSEGARGSWGKGAGSWEWGEGFSVGKQQRSQN